MTRPVPEQATPYRTPEQRWLLETTQRVTNSTIVVDQLAQYPCSIDPDGNLICLRSGLTIEELLHVLPRAALVIAMNHAVDLTTLRPFPLHAVPDIPPPRDTAR